MTDKLRSPQNRVSPGGVSDYELRRLIQDMQSDFRTLERRLETLQSRIAQLEKQAAP